MRRNTTPSFCLTLKLNTSPASDEILNDRFFAGFMMYNKLASHARKSLSGMRQDKEYRKLVSSGTAVSEKLSEIRKAFGLSEYQFHSWIAVQQHRYCNYVDSLTAQKVASSVWKSVEAVIFRKGKTIHFRNFENFVSLEGKNNSSGMRYRKGCLEWMGLKLYPQIRHNDQYAREALKHRVKYCRIIRKPMGTSWHYYLQLVLEGYPPLKHEYLPDGRVGIDPGISTEAVVSENKCMLVELNPERKNIEQEISAIQQQMDRSRRTLNPWNFNADGTVKKHGRKKWICSSRYKKDRLRLKTLRRRNADSAKQSEEKLANKILCEFGSDIISEKMDYSSLAERNEETRKDSETGRFLKKGRFGKSIGYHAPARFISILNRKLLPMGKSVFLVDTYKFRASQFNHVSGEYKKSELSERWKCIDGHKVQRDLYSAFLLLNAVSEEKTDVIHCEQTFGSFLIHHDAEISRISALSSHKPLSFGIA